MDIITLNKKYICITDGCRKEVPKSRKTCWKCQKAKYRKNNPVKAAYQILRWNAQRRYKYHLGFLTFEEFEKFCRETNYIELKGRYKESISIDRIKNYLGYVYDNMRVVTVGFNSAKGVSDEFFETEQEWMDYTECPY